MSKRRNTQKKKRPQTNKTDRRIIEALRNKTNVTGAPKAINVYLLKEKEPLHSLSKIYKETKKIPSFYSRIFPSLLPKKIEDIKAKPLADYSTDIDKDIIWISCLLLDFSDYINKFIRHEDEYESSYLKGNYSNCEKILDDIDTNICISAWSMEKRITLKQRDYGLKEQKSLANEYKAKTNRELPFVYSYISNKIEDKVSYHWFKNELNDALKSTGNDGFYDYLRYKILGVSHISDTNASDFMLCETNSSIIDIYISYIRTLQKVFANTSKQKTVAKLVKSTLEKTAKNIHDLRLKNIALALGLNIDTSEHVDSKIILLLDHYTTGDYSKCLSLTDHLLSKEPANMLLAETFAKCCIRLNSKPSISNSPLGDIIQAMIGILRREGDLYSHYNFLLKESIANSGLDYSYEIYSFVLKEIKTIRENSVESLNIGYFNSKHLSPLNCNAYHSKNVVDRLLLSLKPLSCGETVNLYYEYRLNDDGQEAEDNIEKLNIPEYRKLKVIANKHFFANKYEKAITAYEKLNSCNDELSKIETLGHYAISCLSSNQLEKGCEIIANSYIQKNELHLNLPINYAISSLDSLNWPDSIDIPIVYHMYSEHIAKDKMEHLRYSFENYLKKSDIKRPSQIPLSHNPKKIIFFLEKVCIYDVMKRYLELKGTNDIDKERINILNLLRKLNSQDDDKYLREIKAIAQRIVVKEGVKKAGRSKIYVDTDNIKSAISKEVGERFERYRELVKNGVANQEQEFISRIRQMLSDDRGDIQIYALMSSLHENDSILIWIIRKVFSEFLRGEYGLNNYLSSRIRHGTLLNTLSNPFLAVNILTMRDEEKGSVLTNEHWLNKMNELSDGDKEYLSTLFSNFSESFYLLIDEIKNERIQISYKQKGEVPDKYSDNALFDFDIYSHDIQKIKSFISKDLEYDDFMESVFEHFWAKVEKKLEKIRNYFSDEAAMEFKKLIDQFHGDLDSLQDKSNSIAELKNSLTKARINLQSAIDEVSDWFKRGEASEVGDFTINTPLEIATRMICGFDDIKKFNLDEDIDESILIRGRHLIFLVDIFYPLLDNVIQRSKLPANSREVTVSVHLDNTDIALHIRSSTTHNDNITKTNQDLSQKISKHLSDVTPQMLFQEGGTGFYKIIKAIRNGLHSDISMFNAYFENNNEFIVEIKFSSKGLLA